MLTSTRPDSPPARSCLPDAINLLPSPCSSSPWRSRPCSSPVSRGGPAYRGRRGTATLLGDSLNVGVERYLGDALPGWRIVADDRSDGRRPRGSRRSRPDRPPLSSHVVVSLGTNDPPTGVSAFRADVARLLALVGPNRCVVWATIWRDGAPNDAFNAVLRDAASANRRLRLVEWADMVEEHPDWLADDGLHGNETGIESVPAPSRKR